MINPFKKKYNTEEKELLKFLKSSQLFSCLKNEELDDFFDILTLRKYKEGETVYYQNDPSQAIYLIKKGTVILSHDIGGTEEIIMTLTGGFVFGKNAMLPDKKRLCNAIAIGGINEIYVIPQVALFEVMNKHQKIKAKLMETLSSYYADLIDEVFEKYRTEFGIFELKNLS